eukprot:tig00000262_g23072.t1
MSRGRTDMPLSQPVVEELQVILSNAKSLLHACATDTLTDLQNAVASMTIAITHELGQRADAVKAAEEADEDVQDLLSSMAITYKLKKKPLPPVPSAKPATPKPTPKPTAKPTPKPAPKPASEDEDEEEEPEPTPTPKKKASAPKKAPAPAPESSAIVDVVVQGADNKKSIVKAVPAWALLDLNTNAKKITEDKVTLLKNKIPGFETINKRSAIKTLASAGNGMKKAFWDTTAHNPKPFFWFKVDGGVIVSATKADFRSCVV